MKMEYYNDDEIYIKGHNCPHGHKIVWDGHFTMIRVGDIHCVGKCQCIDCNINGYGVPGYIERFEKPKPYDWDEYYNKKKIDEEVYKKEMKKLYGY